MERAGVNLVGQRRLGQLRGLLWKSSKVQVLGSIYQAHFPLLFINFHSLFIICLYFSFGLVLREYFFQVPELKAYYILGWVPQKQKL